MADDRDQRPFEPRGGRTAGGDRSGGEAVMVSGFARLARTHLTSVGGDALVALALAGSLFFSISPDAARPRVAAYLAFTMAPFALVAPLVGPAIDRMPGGRRIMVTLACLVRSVACLLMIGNLDSLLLFPLAFTTLVSGKAYQVARSAIVPTLVRRDASLVEANSRLALLSGIGGALAVVPGGILLQFGGSPWVMGLAVLVFGAATFLSLKIPRTTVAEEPVGELERAELRSIAVVVAASAMGLLRGIVGFFAFLMAFHLRSIDAATVWFGVLVALTTLGNLAGAVGAPHLRKVTREEHILVGVLGVLTAVAVFVAISDAGLGAAAALAATVGVAAGSGRLAFDSIVQRDAPDANQGRSFARFETRFQLVWVGGALIPVVLPFLNDRIGYLVIASVAGFAGFTYLSALRAIDRGERPVTPAEKLKLAERARELGINDAELVRKGSGLMARIRSRAMGAASSGESTAAAAEGAAGPDEFPAPGDRRGTEGSRDPDDPDNGGERPTS